MVHEPDARLLEIPADRRALAVCNVTQVTRSGDAFFMELLESGNAFFTHLLHGGNALLADVLQNGEEFIADCA